MTDKQIIEMLKDLLNEIDYDIYKTYFVYEGDERISPETLIEIVKEHFDKVKK